MSFIIDEKYVVIDDNVITVDSNVKGLFSAPAGSVLYLRIISQINNFGIINNSYTFDVYRDGVLSGVCVIPDYSKSILSKVKKADSFFMIAGKEYTIIREIVLNGIITIKTYKPGARIKCISCTVDANTGELASYIAKIIDDNEVVVIAAKECQEWASVENSIRPNREVSVVAAEIYDAFHNGGFLKILLEEYKALTGKDKPGFMC